MGLIEGLKEYKCHKEVQAVPMNLGEYNKFKEWTIPEDEDPEALGYLVLYDDGYTSWSPKKQFDEGYKEIN